jgi:hypothetical protein
MQFVDGSDRPPSPVKNHMADLVWYMALRILLECYFLLPAIEGHQHVSFTHI